MRQDIHRPSVIEPVDYAFVAFDCLKVEDMGTAQYLIMQRELAREHEERTGATLSRHAHGGSCHICGAHAIYMARFHHLPTNTYIRTGLECAEKLECVDAGMFRKTIRDAIERKKGKAKAEAVLAAEGLSAAWDVYTIDQTDRYEERTVRDIVGKLVSYGSISEKQMSFLGGLLDKIKNRAQIEAQRAAEHAAAKPVPFHEERVTVQMTIVAIKSATVDEPYDRMMVKHVDGWTLWGTLPASICNAVRGAQIEFSATIKRSDRDAKKGWFSRPTKAKII